MIGKLERWVRLATVSAALLLMALAGPARAQSADTLALLVPDGMPVTDVRVAAWFDAASEEGFRLQAITDSQFMQMGSGALQYRGLILPDQLHYVASDALVTAIQSYVSQGGKAMLVYDFGALNDGGFFPIPKSRFSAMAGVDYVLYDELRDLMVGLGPITGLEGQLRKFQVPPGKSMLYGTTTTTGSTTTARTTSTTATTTSTTTKGVLSSVSLSSGEALYLPASTTNPGGLKGYDHSQFFKVKTETVTGGATTTSSRTTLNATTTVDLKTAKKAPKVSATTTVKLGTTSGGTTTKSLSTLATTTAATGATHAVSGYGYGVLIYPSYVTRGTFAGTALLASPTFGLTAGRNAVGSGEVLFVNTPLSALKGQTDGMLMHGFMRYFGDEMLKLPRLANHPNGVGGLTFNWHLDAQEALQPMQQLKTLGVWKHGPFSMHMTAGPDTITFGDKLGFDLPNNPTAQKFLKDFDKAGHQVGNHGGWIHDYYGYNVSETNQAEFQQYLVLNRQAVDGTVGHATREYSAPQGNNPQWAVDWLEAQGVVGYYFLGHTGMGPTRTYRDGALRNPNMWAFPITPFGPYATFEEFQELGVPKQDVTNWYTQLIDFSVAYRTSREIYAHPPGAIDWSDVLLSMLNYAKTKRSAGQFKWYTMAALADFGTKRRSVTWTVTQTAAGAKQFDASHPTSLATMSWLLPKAGFAQPKVNSGSATVSGDQTHWRVVAKSGTALRFTASPL